MKIQQECVFYNDSVTHNYQKFTENVVLFFCFLASKYVLQMKRSEYLENYSQSRTFQKELFYLLQW